MKNEIKEILDRLERIDHKEYSGGFEFADSGSFDEDCRCFEERKKLANYITNLQEENERLKIEWVLVKSALDTSQSRIEKTIEYNYELQERYCHSALFDDLVASKIYEITEKQLNILQGVGN